MEIDQEEYVENIVKQNHFSDCISELEECKEELEREIYDFNVCVERDSKNPSKKLLDNVLMLTNKISEINTSISTLKMFSERRLDEY